jgi:hypothetical protein
MNYGILDPTYQIKETSAGLMHQMSVLASFYVQSKAQNLIPVKPRLILTGGHNKFCAKLLLDYISLPSDFVDEIPINTSGNNIHVITFNYFPQIAKTLREKFPINLNYKTIAQKIVNTLPKPILCIRVRRGDMMPNVPESANLTIDHVNNVINRYTHSSVYLMTDENDKSYFSAIDKKYQLFDFPQLTNLDDNYAIFCVETYIRDLSDIRISMFTTKDDTEYYHDYLCDYYGIH